MRRQRGHRVTRSRYRRLRKYPICYRRKAKAEEGGRQGPVPLLTPKGGRVEASIIVTSRVASQGSAVPLVVQQAQQPRYIDEVPAQAGDRLGGRPRSAGAAVHRLFIRDSYRKEEGISELNTVVTAASTNHLFGIYNHSSSHSLNGWPAEYPVTIYRDSSWCSRSIALGR